jgi:predicted secreted Zn-dependent protease
VAQINGTATLCGIDYSYKSIIGQTISGIDGRKVGFNISPNGKRYPTVVGARIRFDAQQLDIVLDTFNERIAL